MPKVVLVDWQEVAEKLHLAAVLEAARGLRRKWWLGLAILGAPLAAVWYYDFVVRPNDPGVIADDAFGWAQRAMAGKQYERAAAVMESFGKRYPLHPRRGDAFLFRAQALLAEARRQRDPGLAETIRLLLEEGRTAATRGRVAELRYELAQFLRELGQAEAALREMRAVLLDDPAYAVRRPVYHRDLAHMYVELPAPRLEHSLAELNRYVEAISSGQTAAALRAEQEAVARELREATDGMAELEAVLRSRAGQEETRRAETLRQIDERTRQRDRLARRAEAIEMELANSPQAMMGRGRIYFLVGDYGTAEAVFTDLKDKYPASELGGEADYFLGRIHMHRGEYDRALRRFAGLVGQGVRGPRHEEAILFSGDAVWEQSRALQGAEQEQGRLRARRHYGWLTIDGVRPQLRFLARVRMGQVALISGDLDAAEEAFRAAAGGDVDLDQPGDIEIQRWVDAARVALVGESGRGLSGLAIVCEERDQVDRSRGIFELLRGYFPARRIRPVEDYYFKVARVYRRQAERLARDRADAERVRAAHLNAGLELLRLLHDGVATARLQDVYWEAAESFQAAGKRVLEANALRGYLAGSTDDERYSRALRRLGQCYLDQGLYDHALAQFERNRTLFPKSLFALQGRVGVAACHARLAALRRARARTAQADAARAQAWQAEADALELKALAIYREVIDDPDLGSDAADWLEALMASAELEAGRGNEKRAVDLVAAVLSHTPSGAARRRMHFLLAGIDFARRHYVDARAHYEEVLRDWEANLDDPLVKYAIFASADCLFLDGELEASILAYRRAVNAYFRDALTPWGYFQIGNAEYALGRAVPARASFGRARALIQALPPAALSQGLGTESWQSLLTWFEKTS